MPRWLEHRIPPPVIDVACAVLMWQLALWMPWAQCWPRGGGLLVWGLAIAVALAGALLALLGVYQLARARTTVNPLAPARARQLVSGGIYRYTRNPMYLGMLLALLGWGLWLGNAAAWLVLPAFVVILDALQIKPEERALRLRFGAEFDRYAARVRRWI
jgi:protein-S-isoprenylcysteine O-methyltransferase Ste14